MVTSPFTTCNVCLQLQSLNLIIRRQYMRTSAPVTPFSPVRSLVGTPIPIFAEKEIDIIDMNDFPNLMKHTGIRTGLWGQIS